MKHLRGYQLEGIDKLMTDLSTHPSAILDMATGTGKTVCIAEIIRRFQPKKSLVLAHRKELVRQAKEKVEFFAGLNVSVEMGGQRASRSFLRDYDVVVSSVQSQTPGRRFDPEEFDILIIDEFHHAKPGNMSYMKVINHYRQNPNLKIIGVTATLEKPCLNVIPHVSYRYTLLNAIREGYLVEPRQQMVNIQGLDYSHVRTTAGDLNGAELAAILEAEDVSQRMIQATLEVMFSTPQHALSDKPIEHWCEYLSNFKPKRNLIFTVSVAQARMMSEIFNRVLPNRFGWVCGDKNLISEERREDVNKDFQSGKLFGVCNCGIYSEGYDNVFIDMVTMARPTKSLTLYKQQIGRETRVLPGVIDGLETAQERLDAIARSDKPNALTLDFTGNCGRHKLCSVVDVIAEDCTEEIRERVKRKLEKSEKSENVNELLEEAQADIIAERELREQEEAARKAKLVAKARYSITSVNPFERYDITPKKVNSYDNMFPLKAKQLEFLVKQGVDIRGMSVTHQKQIFFKAIQCPTLSQRKVLLRAGYDTTKMTRREADIIIPALIRNSFNKNRTDAELIARENPPKQQNIVDAFEAKYSPKSEQKAFEL